MSITDLTEHRDKLVHDRDNWQEHLDSPDDDNYPVEWYDSVKHTIRQLDWKIDNIELELAANI